MMEELRMHILPKSLASVAGGGKLEKGNGEVFFTCHAGSPHSIGGISWK
jgi:hypothetical protein